jgi:hypothetical protein
VLTTEEATHERRSIFACRPSRFTASTPITRREIKLSTADSGQQAANTHVAEPNENCMRMVENTLRPGFRCHWPCCARHGSLRSVGSNTAH